MKRALLFAVLVTTSGCAALRAAQAKNAAIERSVREFTYQRSCGEVWAAARTMLFGKDYQVKSADGAAGLTLETEWKGEKDGTSSRYLFQGTAPSEGSCQVVATKATKGLKGSTGTARDWQMEWDLLRQVDAASASKIEQDAESAGELARNQS